jgi:hypothetical protein
LTPLRFLVHDRDHRFGEPFDEVFKQRVWRSFAPRGEPPGRMPMPSVSSGPFAPSVSTGSLSSASATLSQS